MVAAARGHYDVGRQADTTVVSQGGAINTSFACNNDNTATMTGADITIVEYVHKLGLGCEGRRGHLGSHVRAVHLSTSPLTLRSRPAPNHSPLTLVAGQIALVIEVRWVSSAHIFSYLMATHPPFPVASSLSLSLSLSLSPPPPPPPRPHTTPGYPAPLPPSRVPTLFNLFITPLSSPSTISRSLLFLFSVLRSSVVSHQHFTPDMIEGSDGITKEEIEPTARFSFTDIVENLLCSV